MKKSDLVSFLLFGLVALSAPLGEAGSSEVGPHGGVLMSSGGEKLEVSIDSSKNRVRVYVLKRTKDFPGSIGIALRDSSGKDTLLELKTIDPNRHPIQYSSSLTGGSQSYVGIELKIPFQKEAPLILRSTPSGSPLQSGGSGN